MQHSLAIEMTDEIFRHDGYTFEFEANVQSVNGDEVVLDSTAFYPGGGGQVCDIGSLRGCAVTEVFERGDEIVHICPGNDLKAGERIWCSVDWDRRYDLMQGHTGEHLLFCSLKRQCPDLEITKIMISPESKYVIVNHDMTWEQIRAAQEFANKAILDNLTVTKSIMDRDDPELLEKVRIKLDRIPEDEEISVVAIGDIDLSACSGVHVMETSELELLIVDRKVSAGKEGVAIHFKVGQQAKDAAGGYVATLAEVVESIGCKTEDSPKAVANMKSELELKNRLMKQAVKMLAAGTVPENIHGTDVYSIILPGTDRNVLNDFAESVRSKGGVALIVGVTDTLSVMVASGVEGVDCREVLKEAVAPFGGRGGGKPDFAQGGVQDATLADNVLNALKEAAGKSLS